MSSIKSISGALYVIVILAIITSVVFLNEDTAGKPATDPGVDIRDCNDEAPRGRANHSEYCQ